MGNSWEKMDFSYSLFPGLQDLAPFNSFFTGIFPLIWGRHLVWAVASLYSSTTAFCKVQENLIQLIRETGEWSNDLKLQNDLFLIPSVKIPLKNTQTHHNREIDRWIINNSGAFGREAFLPFCKLHSLTKPSPNSQGQKSCSWLTDHTLEKQYNTSLSSTWGLRFMGF